jgi:hypothetical protein
MPNIHKILKRECLNCGGVFGARADNIKRGYGKFCSLSCRAYYYYDTTLGESQLGESEKEGICVKPAVC